MSFLPRLTGQNTFNCQLRDLLALPTRLGGLNINKMIDQSQLLFDNSTRLTRPPVDLILQQSTSGEFLKYKTANDADDARVDIVAENFWCRNRQKSYLDVKVFNPFAKSYVKETLTQCYRHLEQDKKRAYEARVREVELGCFTPLVRLVD